MSPGVECKQTILVCLAMDEMSYAVGNIALLHNHEEEGSEPVFDCYTGDLIVKVGDQEWKAHKSVLRSCPYFSAVIEGNWQESQSSIINLCG